MRCHLLSSSSCLQSMMTASFISFFLLSLLVFLFCASQYHVDFPSTESLTFQFIGANTGACVMSIQRLYTYCSYSTCVIYIYNVRERCIRTRLWLRWWMSRLSPKTKKAWQSSADCRLDRRRAMFPPHLRPTYIRDTRRDRNWHPSPLFFAHESTRIYILVFLSFF